MFVTAFLAAFRRWRTRRATVLALADLDDRTLDDVGLVRGRIPAYAVGLGR
jgi:uncharacterized protein YjiS (DUF1127 family)